MKAAFSFLHSSIFRKFLLSFLAAFVLPISLIFGYLEYTNRQLLTREIYDLQKTTAGYLHRSMDFEFSRYRTFSAMLLNDADINALRKIPYDRLTPTDVLRLKDLRGVLKSFAIDSSVVSRIFLYMATNDLYIDSVRALPLSDAIYTLEDSALLPAEDVRWQAMLNGAHASQWFSAVNRKGNPVLYYIQSLPTAFDDDRCNLMIAISPTYLKEIFDVSGLTESEWIGMVNEEGDVLYSPLASSPVFTLPSASGENGSYVQGNSLYTYYHSKLTHTYYFSVLPGPRRALLTLASGRTLK